MDILENMMKLDINQFHSVENMRERLIELDILLCSKVKFQAFILINIENSLNVVNVVILAISVFYILIISNAFRKMSIQIVY